MKLSADSLFTSIRPYLQYLQRYKVFLFTVVVLVVYGVLVHHIGELIQNEPSQTQIDSKLAPVNKLTVDQDAIKRITDLEQQNVEIKTLFNQARQNPFTE